MAAPVPDCPNDRMAAILTGRDLAGATIGAGGIAACGDGLLIFSHATEGRRSWL